MCLVCVCVSHLAFGTSVQCHLVSRPLPSYWNFCSVFFSFFAFVAARNVLDSTCLLAFTDWISFFLPVLICVMIWRWILADWMVVGCSIQSHTTHNILILLIYTLNLGKITIIARSCVIFHYEKKHKRRYNLILYQPSVGPTMKNQSQMAFWFREGKKPIIIHNNKRLWVGRFFGYNVV